MFLECIYNRALVQTVEQRIHPSLEQYCPSPTTVPPTMLNAPGKQTPLSLDSKSINR